SERIASAQPLSEYFFEYLSALSSLTDIEGRAKLVSTAKPFLAKLSDGVFRDMMFARLNELSGVAVQGTSVALGSAVIHSAVQQQTLLRPQDKGRISTARTVIALLLQTPSLIELLAQRDIEWDVLDFPGLDLLRKIMQAIDLHNPANTGALMELFRETPDYKTVVVLATLQVSNPGDGIERVFCDGLTVLLKQAHENRITQLIEKAKVTELNDAEKAALRKM
ncbi:MAG: DNA primase, partial [Methylococcales bacterium]|nr:DNA primase [Methylococcales bacterium]